MLNFLVYCLVFARSSSFYSTRLTAQQVHEQVRECLKDYPQLLEMFATFLPNQEPKKPVMVEFSEAVSFVNTVKQEYLDQPLVYHAFLDKLRDYQRDPRHVIKVLDLI